MDVLYNAFFLLLAIGILVTFHEAGHFLVARWAGVHVVRFCVGFGKPLLSWRDRRGTEFCVAALPLGGYVRMFDRRDPDAASHAPADPRLAERSYDRLTPQWRLAIALGGPGANFALAFLFYWLAAVVGVTVAIPHVGAVVPDSPADQAGLRAGHEVVAVDGKTTNAWLDVGLALAARLGDSGAIEVETGGNGPAGRHRIPIQDWLVGEDDPDTVGALGLESGLLAAIGDVMADGRRNSVGCEPVIASPTSPTNRSSCGASSSSMSAAIRAGSYALASWMMPVLSARCALHRTFGWTTTGLSSDRLAPTWPCPSGSCDTARTRRSVGPRVRRGRTRD